MPELPEVEVSRMGIAPLLIGQKITQWHIRQPQLRWPIDDGIKLATGHEILDVRRRAKYLLIDTVPGSIILHLGMSGKLRVIDATTPPQKHDHLDMVISNGQCLRFNDPRRFGACLWQKMDSDHPQLARLGPEPLSDDFNGNHLYERSRARRVAVKNFIMDNHVVVGVGNIYASEALFEAGIRPTRAAGNVGKDAYQRLGVAIQNVLARAIEQGGTTLRDFAQVDGQPGYFKQSLNVYGRQGQGCLLCQTEIKAITIGQRSSFYCPTCQR